MKTGRRVGWNEDRPGCEQPRTRWGTVIDPEPSVLAGDEHFLIVEPVERPGTQFMVERAIIHTDAPPAMSLFLR